MTEVEYFNGMRVQLKARPIDLHCVGKGVDPLRTVQHAVSLREEAIKKAKSQRDSFLEYDEVWCVVDVDDHAKLGPALDFAAKVGISLLVSHPSFEVWLLWHYQDCWSGLSTGDAASKLRRHLPAYDKHLPAEFPFDRHRLARWRAEKADPEHTRPNRKGGNPSSNVWLVIESMGAPDGGPR